MNNGFIAVHRTLLEWEWYDNINVKLLFIHCLLKANHTQKKWHGITIERGSFITSVNKLSKELGLTPQQIRTSLSKLKLTNEITIKTTNLNTYISVTNFDKYQTNNKQNNKRITNEQQTDNKRITTTNNDNKDNKDNNENKEKEQYALFVDWINKKFNRQFKPLDKLFPKFQEAKKIYTREEIAKACINAYSDSYHIENKHKYLTIEFLLRLDKIEKFLNIKSNGINKKLQGYTLMTEQEVLDKDIDFDRLKDKRVWIWIDKTKGTYQVVNKENMNEPIIIRNYEN